MPDLPPDRVLPVWLAGPNKGDPDGGAFEPDPEPDPDPPPPFPYIPPLPPCPGPPHLPPFEEIISLTSYNLLLPGYGARCVPPQPDPPPITLDIHINEARWKGAINWTPLHLWPLSANVRATLDPASNTFWIDVWNSGTAIALYGANQICHFFRCNEDNSVPLGVYPQTHVPTSCSKGAYALLSGPVRPCPLHIDMPFERYLIYFECYPGFYWIPGCPQEQIYVFRTADPMLGPMLPWWSRSETTWGNETGGNWGLFCYAQHWYIKLTMGGAQNVWGPRPNVHNRPPIGEYPFYSRYPPVTDEIPPASEFVTLEAIPD